MAPAPQKGEFANTARMQQVMGWMDRLFINDDPVIRTRGNHRLDVYRELLRDDQIEACYGQRILAVQSAEWEVVAGGEGRQDKAAADFLRDVLANLRWDEITGKMLYARHYGFAVGECLWGRDGRHVFPEDVRVRDQNRWRMGMDGRLYLMDPGDVQGVPMPDRKFWRIVVGGENDDQPYGRGLGHQLYWPAYFKRGGMKHWMIFLERFAQPTPMAKLPAGQIEDKEARSRALELLQAIQSDSGVLAPDTIPVELLEATRNGTADYDTLREGMDRAIAKVILGQTMTSDQRGGQHKAEVAKDVRDELVKADADLISESFHRQPLQWLLAWNYPNAAPPRVWRNTEPEDDLNDRAERDQKVTQLGYRPTPEYITATYGPGWEPKDGGGDGAEGAGDLQSLLDDDADFAEARGDETLHRGDQQALVQAANKLANRYEDVIGERVTELLSYLEETGDYETFKARLAEAVDDKPPRQSVDTHLRSGIVARLMGSLRRQR